MRIEFIALFFMTLALFACLSAAYGAFDSNQTDQQHVSAQLDEQLAEAGRSDLFHSRRLRDDLKFLINVFNENQTFSGNEDEFIAVYGEDGVSPSDDDGVFASLPPGLSAKIMSGPQFQRLVRTLQSFRPPREIFEGSQSSDNLFEKKSTSDDNRLPAQFVYLMVSVPDQPVEKYITYLVDLDYLPVDENGDGDLYDAGDYEGNPIGNVGAPFTEETHLAFRGELIAEKEYTRDQWGDAVISGFLPILDEDGTTLAVLGLDYDVRQVANQIEGARSIFQAGLIAASILAGLIVMLLFFLFSRKGS